MLLLCGVSVGFAGQGDAGKSAVQGETGAAAQATRSGSASAGSEAEAITDEQRGALTVTAYDLQLHLEPALARVSGVARLRIRNDGAVALPKLALQLSSTLRWDAVSGRSGTATPAKLPFDQHRVDTDADHTGAANEAVVTLPTALAPGGSVELAILYSGAIEPSAARLVRAGESIDQASAADWDAIGPEGTALRGFGNVLWYPVASPQIFLEDGARLAEAIGEQRRRQSAATVRLRLEIESAGAAEGAVVPKLPMAAFFCGRAASFSVVNEGSARGGEADTASTPVIATAEWPAAALGFGPLSLFVSGSAPVAVGGPIAVAGASAEDAARVEAVASAAEPLVAEWLGTPREREPVLLAHAGEPFAQRALLVETTHEAASMFPMTHLESHAFFSSPELWLDEGVAQFLPLVAIERAQGRATAVAQLRDMQPALSLADVGGEARAGGAPVASEALVEASREVFFRNKAVAVLWMLRSVVGDAALKTALAGLRHLPERDRTAKSFEAALEAASGKELGWFFRDWVYADRGLPDLSIVSAAARALPGTKGQPDGNLVAVEVRNDGGATAEVPVTVRSGTLTATERLRVPAKGSASVRILFQGTPEQVEVNDGTVPEVVASEHLLRLGDRSRGSGGEAAGGGR